MKKSSTTLPHRQTTTSARLAFGCFLIILLVTIALVARVAIRSGNAAVSGSPSPSSSPTPAPSPSITRAPFNSNAPVQTAVTRVSVVVGDTRNLQVATGVDSFVMVSPEIAAGLLKNRFTISLKGLKIGESILLITYGKLRQTYLIDVAAKPASDGRTSGFASQGDPAGLQSAFSGGLTTTYVRESGGGASLMRQSIELRKRLSKDRTLLVSGEMFRLFNNRNSGIAIARDQSFALNRFTLGLETPEQRIDVLDSQINISPMSFAGYSMRGFHLVRTPKFDAKGNFRKKGAEFYAGLARPSLAFFGMTGGKFAGAIIPVFTTDNFQARAGVTAVAADRTSRLARGGVIAHADAIYAPTKEIAIDVETSLARGDLSWRARVDITHREYGGSAEVTRFARSSPLNSIWAQSGGRKSELASFYWRPVNRLSTSVGFNHTEVSRLTSSLLADYGRSLMFANISYGISSGSRIHLRYTDQKIESAFPSNSSRFEIQTRTFLVGSNNRIGKAWTNSIEGRINFNRETNADTGLERGFSLNEQLRFGWRGGSVTGFVRYNRRSLSLASLIVRNPHLLPPTLQAAFALNPAEFLQLNRDRIAFLLGGVELPQTRSLDTGIRFQKTFSRFTLSGETRYNGGETYGINQKDLSTSIGVAMQLDRSNALQVNVWKSVGSYACSAMTVSFTHRFGSSEGGFQFSRIFSFSRSSVKGRVFYDLNGNGQDDPYEPGAAGVKVQIDGKSSVTTGRDGTYEIKTSGGSHTVAVLSSRFGVSLLASTATERRVDLKAGETASVGFGIRDSGSVAGKVTDDGAGATSATGRAGLAGIRVILRSSNPNIRGIALERVTGNDGSYEFRDIRPGKYSIEFDAATIPADYVMPADTAFEVTVTPLNAAVIDFAIAAQRAITGVIFVDVNRDGAYTPGIDEIVPNGTVSAGTKALSSDATGTYFFRNLPAGQTTLMVKTTIGFTSVPVTVNFGPAPETKRGFNLKVDPQ